MVKSTQAQIVTENLALSDLCFSAPKKWKRDVSRFLPCNYHVEKSVNCKHQTDVTQMEVFRSGGNCTDGVPLNPRPRQLCREHHLQSKAHCSVGENAESNLISPAQQSDRKKRDKVRGDVCSRCWSSQGKGLVDIWKEYVWVRHVVEEK